MDPGLNITDKGTKWQHSSLYFLTLDTIRWASTSPVVMTSLPWWTELSNYTQNKPFFTHVFNIKKLMHNTLTDSKICQGQYRLLLKNINTSEPSLKYCYILIYCDLTYINRNDTFAWWTIENIFVTFTNMIINRNNS